MGTNLDLERIIKIRSKLFSSLRTHSSVVLFSTDLIERKQRFLSRPELAKIRLYLFTSLFYNQKLNLLASQHAQHRYKYVQ